MTRLAIAFLTLSFVGGLQSSRAEDVRISILVVLATGEHNKIDEKIKSVAEEIQKKNPKLTGFRLDRTINQSLEPGKPYKINLIEKADVEILADKRRDGEDKITLTISPPTLGQITYTCVCGKYMPMLTDYTTANKERLVIVVMSKPCTRDSKEK